MFIGDVKIGGTYQANHDIVCMSGTVKKGTKVKVLGKPKSFTDAIEIRVNCGKYIYTTFICAACEISPIQDKHSRKKHKPFVVIYRDGALMVAKEVTTGFTGVARCNPKDKFNYAFGANLAVQRLTRNEPTHLEKDIKKLLEKYCLGNY